MTYARARLWVGVSGVGTIVTASSAALAFGLPSYLPTNDVAALSLVLGVYAAISFPFDLAGGYLLPCGHGRMCRTLPAFLWTWLRGAVVHALCLGACGAILLGAGRAAGFPGAFFAALALMVALLAVQLPLSQVIGGLHPAAPDLAGVRRLLAQWRTPMPPNVTVVAGIDTGFVGGLAGLPGRERLVLPHFWIHHLPAESVAVQMTRRAAALSSGSRFRGVLLGIGWNLTGFAVASFLPGSGVSDAKGLVTLALWFTLWSFLGLLTLPSLSRPGVFEVDRHAAASGAPAAVLVRSLTEFDQLQDDEPKRAPAIEAIFHPIPSVASRRAHLETNDSARGCWQGARTALYLSWACLGFLSRAVHCNAGRPELWVLFPGD
ncbi:MAG: hypothetical protein SFV54_16740 [Bryobacteraceae bacterium]|nr:hypothetical protein [Bryobacteraceae bacterium]